MAEHVDKTPDRKSQAAGYKTAQPHGSSGLGSGFVDKRAVGVMQRKLQEVADGSARAKQAAQLQTMADNSSAENQLPFQRQVEPAVIQMELKEGAFNVVGENHKETEENRKEEGRFFKNKQYINDDYRNLWAENQFYLEVDKDEKLWGDNKELRWEFIKAKIQENGERVLENEGTLELDEDFKYICKAGSHEPRPLNIAEEEYNEIKNWAIFIHEEKIDKCPNNQKKEILRKMIDNIKKIREEKMKTGDDEKKMKTGDGLRIQRSKYMLLVADMAAEKEISGVWKIGDNHITDMVKFDKEIYFTITSKEDFYKEMLKWKMEEIAERQKKIDEETETDESVDISKMFLTSDDEEGSEENVTEKQPWLKDPNPNL